VIGFTDYTYIDWISEATKKTKKLPLAVVSHLNAETGACWRHQNASKISELKML